jgi:hypothetical protein
VLFGAGGDDDDVGVGADGDVVPAGDGRHRDELQAVVEVEQFGLHLLGLHVEEADPLGDPAQQACVRDRRPDTPGSDDRDFGGAFRHGVDCKGIWRKETRRREGREGRREEF